MRKNYVVREGDTLSSIAKRYYGFSSFWVLLSVINLKRNNGLEKDKKLRVPTI